MAIFKRRHKRGMGGRIRESLWPTMGWIRTMRYYYHRMFRKGDSAYKITAGLSTGAALSFTPFLGTHILQALFVSWLLRANMVAGFVGTVMGNPWTYPIIFVTAYKSGIWLCTLFGLQNFAALPDDIFISNADHDPWTFLTYMFSHPLKLLLPLTLGGYLCAVSVWPLCYVLLYYPVRAARAAYLLNYRKKKKEHKA